MQQREDRGSRRRRGRLLGGCGLAAAALLFIACPNVPDDEPDDPVDPISDPPVACITGPTGAGVGETVVLYPSGTTDDEDSADTLRYAWEVVGTPEGSSITTGSLGAADSHGIEFTVDLGGTFTISLTVTDSDDQGDTATHSIAVTVPPDTIAPTVNSFSIEDGAATVYAPLVLLSADVVDAGTGVVSMRFSNDNVTWSGWTAYAAVAGWEMEKGAGTRTVYAQFVDAAGNVAVTNDSVTINTAGPTSTVLWINGYASGTTTSTRSVSLTVQATGAVDMCFSNDGGTYGGWMPYTTSPVAWTLTDIEGQRTVCAMFRDSHGNVSLKTATATLDTTSPEVQYFIASVFGDTISSLTPSMVLSVPEAVEMSFNNDGGAWSGWTWISGMVTDWALPDADGLHTVNARFRDIAGNVSTASGTVTVDRVKPVASSCTINGGATTTDTPSVTLGMSVTGAVEMAFRNNPGGVQSAWVPYAATHAWNLPDTDGTWNVEFSFRDAAGNQLMAGRSITLNRGSVKVNSFALNSGAAWTTSRTVTLASNVTGATQMRFRDSGGTWGSWVTYAPATSRTLPDSDGSRVVEAEYRDGSGNLAIASDGIILDRAAPTVSYFSINAGDASTNETGVAVGIYAATATEMRFSNDNVTWSAWEPYTYSQSKTWTLAGSATAAQDGTRTVYGQFRDAAGNVAGTSDTITLDYWKTVRVRIDSLHCVNSGDWAFVNLMVVPGSGEWYWNFQGRSTSDVTCVSIHARTEDSPWRCEDDEDLVIGHSRDFTVRNRAGEFVILLGALYDDDHPFFDDTVGSFAVYYGYPTFTYAAGGGHVFLNEGDGPQGYVYFTFTILN